MKPTTQQPKQSPTKQKKLAREKRKSHGENQPKKRSPIKEQTTRFYAGIDTDSLKLYTQQIGLDSPVHEEALKLLAEDINYKLRYIINDSLVRSRLNNTNAITSCDINATFEQLSIEKVYGAPESPLFHHLPSHNVSFLDDKIVNLPEIAEKCDYYEQNTQIIIEKKWTPEATPKGANKALKNYFGVVARAIVDNDDEIRAEALDNLSKNTKIGAIIDWFYNFAYILLSKDVTCHFLTSRALNLVKTLELSPQNRFQVPEKQLKLLVRLLLQRLLKPGIDTETCSDFCEVLGIISERGSLKDFILMKIDQKLSEIIEESGREVLVLINRIGIDAIESIFFGNIDLWLRMHDKGMNEALLALFKLLIEGDLVDLDVYNKFYSVFGDSLALPEKGTDLYEKLKEEKGKSAVASTVKQAF